MLTAEERQNLFCQNLFCWWHGYLINIHKLKGDVAVQHGIFRLVTSGKFFNNRTFTQKTGWIELMDFRKYLVIFFLLGEVFFFVSCSKATVYEDQQALREEIRQAQEKIKANPLDTGAITELGILYYRTNELQRASRLFAKALEIEPNYPPAVCYLGLTLEATQRPFEALGLYASYKNYPSSSPFFTWLKGRYQLVRFEQEKAQLIEKLRMEKADSTKRMNRNTLAVFPFKYHGENPIYFPLGKGLAELLVKDLSQIPQLTVIERWKIEVLLNEIRRQTTSLTNENTTIRIGKFFGAGTVIRSSYNVLEDNILIVDVAHWNLLTGQFPSTTTHADKLENLLYLEKEIFLNVLEKIGLTIPEEAQQIVMELPTENWEAFLAFSSGLAKEDQGFYREALRFLEKAQELDRNFNLCKERISRVRLFAIGQSLPPSVAPKAGSVEVPNAESIRLQ